MTEFGARLSSHTPSFPDPSIAREAILKVMLSQFH